MIIHATNFTGLIGRGGPDAEFDVGLHCGDSEDRKHGLHPPQKQNTFSVSRVNAPIIQTRPIIVHNKKGDEDPDSDTNVTGSDLNILLCGTCEKSTPVVTLSARSFAPIDPFRSVLYFHDAFWALPPGPMSDGLSSVWWGMAVQRLLWSTDNRLGLLPQTPNIYEYQMDDEVWKDECDNKKDLKTHLMEWKCKYDLFSECVKTLASYLQGNDLITSDDFKQILHWVKTLNHLGYSWPRITPLSVQRMYSPYAVFKRQHRLPKSPPKKIRMCDNWENLEETYENTFMKTSLYKKYSNTILVVVYTRPAYETIPYFHFFHEPIFKHIIYCKTSKENTELYNVNFVTYNGTKDGAFFYTCMALVMQMQFPVDGYMLTSDDVLLNIQELGNTDLENIEQSIPKNISIIGALTLKQTNHRNITVFDAQTLKQCNNGVCNAPLNWVWTPMYKNEIRTIIRTLKQESVKSYTVKVCVKRLQSLTGGENRFFGTVSEVFYIPSVFTSRFIELAWLFANDNVYVDIAVPTLLHCMADEKSIKYKYAVSLPFGEDRNRPWIKWDEFTQNAFTYIHPSNLEFLTKGKSDVKELNYYCNKVLPYVFTELSKFLSE